MNVRRLLAVMWLAGAAWASEPGVPAGKEQGGAVTTTNKVTRTDDEWRAMLKPEQYRILRQQGTERAFTGVYWNHFEDGRYRCAGCGEELFDSASKFDAHCGWPSFDRSAASNRIEYLEDRSHGMVRTEVRCAKCGGHLGHVFDDGPTSTRRRYCINSASIDFEKRAPAPPKK